MQRSCRALMLVQTASLAHQRALPYSTQNGLQLREIAGSQFGAPLALNLSEYLQRLCPRCVPALRKANDARPALVRRIRTGQIAKVFQAAKQPVHGLLADPGPLCKHTWTLTVRPWKTEDGDVRLGESSEL